MIENHLFQFVSFIYVSHDKDRESLVMINDDSHILHITKGTARIRISDIDEFDVHRGDVVFIPRRTPFYMMIKRGFEMQNLHYKMCFDNDEYMDEKLRLPYHFSPVYFDNCEKCLRSLHDMTKKNKSIFKRASVAYDIITTHMCYQELIRANISKRDEIIYKATEYLSSPECSSFDIAKIARSSCMSTSQLNRRFLAHIGTSPHKFWEKQRLKAVCIKLKYSDKTIGEIADEFEFSSPYYFTRWFKKNMKCTPSRFRKEDLNY